MEDTRRPPAFARRSERLVGLVVAGDEHGRRLDHGEHVDQLFQPAVDGGEVTRRDDHVDLAGPIRQAAGLAQVAVDVAEGEQAHGQESVARPTLAPR
jgi:hypothetical protein